MFAAGRVRGLALLEAELLPLLAPRQRVELSVAAPPPGLEARVTVAVSRRPGDFPPASFGPPSPHAPRPRPGCPPEPHIRFLSTAPSLRKFGVLDADQIGRKCHTSRFSSTSMTFPNLKCFLASVPSIILLLWNPLAHSELSGMCTTTVFRTWSWPPAKPLLTLTIPKLP